MRVLISGAGPAGLTAAYWLRRYGYRPTIVEQAPSLVLALQGFGQRLLLDVRRSLAELGHSLQGD
jgi:2-polyprenyl-6-methoxyphenol hydroxylase-like FAD-dependent oxidoreductase